jgi:tRNA C32,U32 (ribose-2'-O)-methylase TrmJ
MMGHLDRSLSTIGFLDPSSPQRILRKLRRLFGRAGITDNEVAIIRGICRQMEWAARTAPLSSSEGRSASMEDQGRRSFDDPVSSDR